MRERDLARKLGDMHNDAIARTLSLLAPIGEHDAAAQILLAAIGSPLGQTLAALACVMGDIDAAAGVLKAYLATAIDQTLDGPTRQKLELMIARAHR